MKIVCFLHDSQERWGVLDGPDIFLVRGDVFGQFTVLDSRVATDSVSLLSPCRPSKGVGIGKNYLGHAHEMHSDLPAEPIIFLKPSTSLLSPGGVIVIAHPGDRRRNDTLLSDAQIGMLVDAGLDGLEVWHRGNLPDQRRRLLDLARKYGLLVTGGSDWHGAGKPNALGENLTDAATVERIVERGVLALV